MRAATALNVTQYTYDADGNRLQEKVNRSGGAQGTTPPIPTTTPGPKLSGGIRQDVETLIKAGAKPWRPKK